MKQIVMKARFLALLGVVGLLIAEGDAGDLVRTAIAVSLVSAALIAFIYFGNRD